MATRFALWGPLSRFGALTAVAAFVTDQAHKWWMLKIVEITERQVITVTSFFDLVLVWNRGVSYGWFQQNSKAGVYILIALTAVAIAAMIVWLAKCDSGRVASALGLVIGGALGNGADRVIFGAVADFFSFHAFGFYWYIFNLADVAIVAGVAILLYDSVMDKCRADSVDDSRG